jgi:lipoate-protein ligase A
VACDGEPVTSMKELLGHEIEMGRVEDRIIERFAEVFEMELEAVGREVCGSAA